MRKAQAILRLGEKWGKDLEKASEKAMAFGNTNYRNIAIRQDLPRFAHLPFPVNHPFQTL